MRKKIIALTALLALTAFSGCQSAVTTDVTTPITTTTAEITTTTAETTTTTAETTTTTTEITTTTAETTTVETTTAETTTTAADDPNLFRGTGYTISVDDTWLDCTEYLDLIAELAEDTEIAQKIDITAEQMQELGDAVFFHSSYSSSFNVVISETGEKINELELLQLSIIIKEQYSSGTGYSCQSCERVTVNGYRALKVDLTSKDPATNADIKMVVYLFYPGTKQIGFTFSAFAEEFDTVVVDFEKVLNTVSFD